MPILDPIAALIVGLIICKTAWEIFVESSHMLTDGIDPDKWKNTLMLLSILAVWKTL